MVTCISSPDERSDTRGLRIAANRVRSEKITYVLGNIPDAAQRHLALLARPVARL